jgi:hypothetical protein
MFDKCGDLRYGPLPMTPAELLKAFLKPTGWALYALGMAVGYLWGWLWAGVQDGVVDAYRDSE